MPSAETYVSCIALPATINGVAANIESGGFKVEMDVDEMTNNNGGGFYEDAPTVLKATFKMKVAYKKVTTLGLVSGSLYPVIINTGGTPTFSGTVRLMLDGSAMLDVKAGLHVDLSGITQGQFTYTF